MLGRTLIRLALVAGVLVLVAGPVRSTLGTDGERPQTRIPRPPTEGLPPEMGQIVDDIAAVQRQSLAGKLGGLGKGGGGAPPAPAPAAGGPRPFADHGSRRQIARLRRDVARALRTASLPDDRVAVLAWHGVYVSGRRAVALADLQRRTRLRRGLPFRTRSVQRTRLELVRDGRRWLITARGK
jgi:hypothetical protein